MTFKDLIAEKKLSVYKLSKISNIPATTLNDIANSKTNIVDCSGRTLLALSQTLDIKIEDLLKLEKEPPKGFYPPILEDSIKEFRDAIRKDSTLIDCYSDQLNSSINVAEVENLISHEEAHKLRKRYIYGDEDYWFNHIKIKNYHWILLPIKSNDS